MCLSIAENHRSIIPKWVFSSIVKSCIIPPSNILFDQVICCSTTQTVSNRFTSRIIPTPRNQKRFDVMYVPVRPLSPAQNGE